LENHTKITSFAQQIFVHGLDDTFTISIDSSGDLLHKRGLKTQGGTAPLRETIAAAVLMLADYHIDEPLLDPMCGSGTFALEAAMIANNIPAGWYRNFAFMDWPCFKPSRWKGIRREAEKKIKHTEQPIIFASDNDPGTCNSLKKETQANDLIHTINVFEKDFFDLQPSDILRRDRRFQILKQSKLKGLITLNPPYGRRLLNTDNPSKLFTEIGNKLKKDFNGWKIALIIPNKNIVKKLPFPVTSHSLFHGGLNLTLLTGKIK
jgi:putative N6-adenine-specific DNA methylase